MGHRIRVSGQWGRALEALARGDEDELNRAVEALNDDARRREAEAVRERNVRRQRRVAKYAAVVALLIALGTQGSPLQGTVLANASRPDSHASCASRARTEAARAVAYNVRWTYAPRAYARDFAALFIGPSARPVCSARFVGLEVDTETGEIWAGRASDGSLVTGP